ncbi:hypothetical protein G4Q83_05315 [Xanthomonas theicola]|nr:hypothetical protein G4Q83_05315 [Xanthomonas theicola]
MQDDRPTVAAAYNEADSLPLLHPRIMQVLETLDGVRGRALYVDDGVTMTPGA